MSREQIVATLLSHGAFSLIRTIEDLEAGRARRVRIEPVCGDPTFTRAVMGYLYSLGAQIEIARPITRSYMRAG